MNVCFRGGAGDSRAARSIRGLAKNMKAMSLKAKAAGGAGHARRRQRREADPRERHKDGSGATSAKIAPAQPQDDRRHDHLLHTEEDCDKCCSPSLDADDDAAEKGDDGADEWVAEPEPGVLMTLAPRPDGTNRLRKVRFRDELFDDWAAQSWWAYNHDRIVELYSLVNQSDGDGNDDAPVTPCQSDSDEEEPLPDATAASEPSSGSRSSGTAGSPILGLVTAPDTIRACKTPPPTTMTTTTPKAVAPAARHEDGEEEGDMSDHQERNTPWTEWVEEYEPGVFITVRAYPDHPLQLRHVELSRDKFGEVKARVWWQENKDRLRSFYSF
ncbi:putative protein Brevis radix-like 5 [Triticum dicoccoides]|uniref:putative protein Brevis radix-like 5 n=1 Tax=Triticum dicoccoides TaxID=85692 RepID=UPI00188EC284|nr:putative protein Brevis radix-like 5 [Triticum dicoccoides]